MHRDEPAIRSTESRLQRHYDLVATVGTAGVFLALGVPWPLWVGWSGLLIYQIGNRLLARR